MQGKIIRRAIVVCSLGYFIDVFDIQLFAVLRVASLTELGIPPDRIRTVGGNILNIQMGGMLLGAFLWSYLGDRFGRLKALYGSILIYSIGTLACSFVHDVGVYSALRFITGFGLAGEMGAAITLVGELMPASKRGWGITIVSSFGLLGPAFAVLISWYVDWRATYLIAGMLGFVLLVLRMRLVEPAIFSKIAPEGNPVDTLKAMLKPHQLKLFICCMLIGFPFAYLWNLLNFFSLELSREILLPGEIFDQKLCLLLFYAGASISGLIFGGLSQKWRSHRKSLACLLLCGAIIACVYLMIGPIVKMSANSFYLIYLLLGLAATWLMFPMIAVEHAGTNIRASSAILVANIVRSFAIPMILVFRWLTEMMSAANAALIIGVVIYLAAFLALRPLRETHGSSLDYTS